MTKHADQFYTLHVVALSGTEVACLRVPSSSSVGYVKQLVMRQGCVKIYSVTSFALAWHTQVLADLARLKDLDLPEDATIQFVRLPQENIAAILRVRPRNAREDDKSALSVDAARSTAILTQDFPGGRPCEREILLDGAYPVGTSQHDVFEGSVRGLVTSVLEGYNATVVIHGIPGSGKLHTMIGGGDARNAISRGDVSVVAPSLEGVLPRVFDTLAADIAANATPRASFALRASFLEMAECRLRDLLPDEEDPEPPALNVVQRDAGSFVVAGLQSRPVRRVRDLRQALCDGFVRLLQGALVPLDQDRSHFLFTISVEAHEESLGGRVCVRRGTLQVVKMAGYCRSPSAGNEAFRPLANVIACLSVARGSGEEPSVPYRGSALTSLLRDSLGGSSRTLFIATCGPAAQDFERSLATARFVARARQVQNMVAVHEEVLDAETALRSGLHAEETWLPEQP
mmetsp:Transcript_24242/g.68744  ORF Transcript_24242/g.68744 Transcript_24242/m.68744 type:complete len:458 (+) Transcript_24242:33-1406(+)